MPFSKGFFNISHSYIAPKYFLGFPTLDHFENDFIEPEYDDEQFEPEFGRQHQNDIKERFEEERGERN